MFAFIGKSKTLDQLEGQLESAIVLPQVSCSERQWIENSTEVLNKIDKKLGLDNALVVRSSHYSEDTQAQSNAGKYTSILNIYGKEAISNGFKDVFKSFPDHNKENRAFAQPLLANIVRSGVLFTQEPSSTAPYYVINYDELGTTDSVTSGTSITSTIYYAKCGLGDANIERAWVKNLIRLGKELELKFDCQSLDIEFAFDENEQLYLFQVRPLPSTIAPSTLKKKLLDNDHIWHSNLLKRIAKNIDRVTKPHPYLNGRFSLLGIMPDWNPAEIIGVRPNPLALSLYKELITDNIWAYQRDNYGYKSLRSFPLLLSLSGQPFIDVRVSFNSFIPADLPDDLAEKLVEHYLNLLKESPENHDKIEFEIILSCYSFDFHKKSRRLTNNGFSKQEIACLEASLNQLTNSIISKDGLWKKDKKKISKLENNRTAILTSDLTNIEKVYWLIEDCKRFGTLPFAGLARAGFIAVQLLQSLVEEDFISKHQYHAFMHSIKTVSSKLSNDRKKLSFSDFINKYGHLRPGTYDITSPRYDNIPEYYFDETPRASKASLTGDKNEGLKLSKEQSSKIAQALERNGINHDTKGLFEFIRQAIEAREHSKFIFTKSLSDVIELLKQVGFDNGFSISDMALFDIKAIAELYNTCGSTQEVIQNHIDQGYKLAKESESLILPPLIASANDVYYFELPNGNPNYIGLGKATGPVIYDLNNKSQLDGAIVFIRAADPGFDWLFEYNIAGFVTQFGGANSHMAIRANELGIPAVIGAGKILFERWQRENILTIEAANKKVTAIQ